MSGRLVLVVGSSGADSDTVAEGVRRGLRGAVRVDAAALQDLVGLSTVGSLLRAEAALLVAGLYAAAGYDAVVTDDVADEDLGAFYNRAVELVGRTVLFLLGPHDDRCPGIRLPDGGPDAAETILRHLRAP